MAIKLPKETGLVVGIIVVVIIVAGALIWLLRRGFGDLTKGASDLLGGVGGLASGVSEGLGNAGGFIGDATASIGEAGGNLIGVVTAPLSSEFVKPTKQFFGGVRLPDEAGHQVPGAPHLKLEVLNKKDSGGSGFINKKTTSGKFRVTANGKPVANANIRGILTHPLTNWTTKDGPFNLWTNDRGEVDFSYWVRDLAGTAAEDDARWQAFADGYNPSNKVVTK